MSATGVTLFAALPPRAGTARGSPAKPAGPPAPGWGGSFLLPGLYLVGALLVGAVVIAVAGRWRRRPRSVTATASEQLTEFRSLYEKGQMSREEFERVRARLGTEIRTAELGSLPPPAPAEPASPPASSPPETAITAAGATAETPPSPPPANGTAGGETPPDTPRPA
jgi:hypothetical protein